MKRRTVCWNCIEMNELTLNEREIKWGSQNTSQIAVRLHNWLLIYSQLHLVGQTERARLFGFRHHFALSWSDLTYRDGSLPSTNRPLPGPCWRKTIRGCRTLVPPACFFLQMAKVAVSGWDVSLSQTACSRLIRSPLKQDERDKVAQPVNKKSFAALDFRPCQDETSPWLHR